MTAPLAFWTFAAPAMLAGLLLLALPVIAHLLHQRMRHFHVFPSLRFFQSSTGGHQSRSRLRRLLLLLLRCLALAALVLAFALPAWRSGSSRGAADGQGATVVVMDTTPSMGRRVGGVILFEEAKSAVRRALDDAERDGDRVNVLLVEPAPRPLLPELTANTAALRAEVDALSPSPSRGSPVAAVRRAMTLLREHEGPRRLILVSDFQANNWPAPLTGSMPGDIDWTRVDLTESTAANLAVHQPSVRPPRPVPGQPATVSFEVTNHSDAPQTSGVRVSLEGRTLHSRTLDVPARGAATVRFQHAFDSSGHRVLEAELTGTDALEIDNHCPLTVPVGERPDVLLVSDTDPDTPGTAAYFLLRALAPAGDDSDPHRVLTLRGGQLEDGVPANAQAVVLGGMAALTPVAAGRLGEYLERGGDLVVFAAEPGFRQTADLLDRMTAGGALPWTPAALQSLPADEPAWFGIPEPDAPVMRGFDPEVSTAFRDIPVLSRWTPEGELHPEGRTVLRFTDGVPALSLRALAGGGHCLLVNASPDLRHSRLGRSGFFVALVQSLMEEAARGDAAGPEARPGEAFSFTHPLPEGQPPTRPRVVGPDGRPVFDAEFLHIGSTLACRVPNAETPGVYRILDGDRLLGLVAVRPDPRESDLRTLPSERRDALLPEAGSTRALGTLEPDEALTDSRVRPVWGWMFAAGLMLLASESLLLGAWRR